MVLSLLLLGTLGSLFFYLTIVLTRRYYRLKQNGATQPLLHKLHQKHGTLVRIGPDTVSFRDPAYISTVFSPRGGFIKADSYSSLRAFVHGRSVGSILDLQDEEKRKAIKRAIGTVFLTNELMQLYQLDFMLRIAFSEDTGCLRQGRDLVGLSSLTYQRIAHGYAWQPAPSLERFVFQNKLWSGWLSRSSRWAREGMTRVETRRRAPFVSSPKTTGRRKDLLEKYIAASEKHPDAIPPPTLFSITNSTISAGTDTTAGTVTVILSYLLRNPLTLSKLLRELESAGVGFPVLYAATENLPYLDAVIKEALRLHAVIGTTLERMVPPQGCMPGGVKLPGGTVIGCAPYVIHRDQEIYGEDIEDFRPERWLGCDEARKQTMERASLAWSQGSRICMGKHLAELEMKKLIPTLLWKFDLSDPDRRIVFEKRLLEGEERPILIMATSRR
ncbi:cytochrome P450 [Podospora australis]|uniref:Cytochrome P450 n=1 Tax=Podospora australis TaxID=1536484 RepID=A0AAN6WIA5_9PEZI|nr:cytochrome P450 [Podospora australis]